MTRTTRFSLFAGAVAGAAVAAFVLMSRPAVQPVDRSSADGATHERRDGGLETVPFQVAAYTTVDRGSGRGSEGAVAPEASVHDRARSLLSRLVAWRDVHAGLPADLREAVIALLDEGPAARDALFSLAWTGSTHGLARAHLGTLISSFEEERANTLMAAFQAFDPAAEHRREMTDLARDTDELARWLDSGGDPEARAVRIRQIPRTSVSDDGVSATLRRIARDDPSETVRVESLWLLASSRSHGVPAFLAERSADVSRSLKERNAAAYSLGIHPDGLDVEALLDVFDRVPAETRVFLYRSLGTCDGDSRVDDRLLAGVGESDARLRRAAAFALGLRIQRLGEPASTDLASRTATLLRSMDESAAGIVLNGLGTAVTARSPLAEVVAELHRASSEGGPIRTAIASSPVLRRAIGY